MFIHTIPIVIVMLLFLYLRIMKFANWASKYTFVIFFCGVLSINQGEDNFMKDYDNALESNVAGNNVKSQPNLKSDQKSENILQDEMTASKKRGSKIIELKQVITVTIAEVLNGTQLNNFLFMNI